MNHSNLWAPWRIEYLKSLEKPAPVAEEEPGCFLCRYWNDPQRDKDNLVLWRTHRSMVLLNRFPYTGGHLLIAPADHAPSLDNLTHDALLELMLLTRDAQKVLIDTIKPHGFNVGMNIHRCAGAGLPDHIHLHIVPRWEGDTNFMSVCGDVRVISQGLESLYQELIQAGKKLNLPARDA